MENKDNIIEEVVELTEESSQNNSSVKISADVVATIAGVATTEIEGVAGMCTSFAGGIAEKFGGKKSLTKGIKASITDNSTIIDLYVIVDFGVRIPELAWEIQENVKNSVETMTGLKVEKVNIHIDGISFKKSELQPEEASGDDENADDEIIIEEVELEDIPSADEAF